MRDKKRAEQKRLAQQLGTHKSEVPEEIRGKVRVTSPRITFISVREPSRPPKWKSLFSKAERAPFHLGVLLLVSDADGIRLLRSVLARAHSPRNKGDLASMSIVAPPTTTEKQSRFVRPATVNAVLLAARGTTDDVSAFMHDLGNAPEQLGLRYRGGDAMLTDDHAFFDDHWAKPHRVELAFAGAPVAPPEGVFDFRCAAMSMASAKRDKHDGHFSLTSDGGPRHAQVHLRVSL